MSTVTLYLLFLFELNCLRCAIENEMKWREEKSPKHENESKCTFLVAFDFDATPFLIENDKIKEFTRLDEDKKNNNF